MCAPQMVGSSISDDVLMESNQKIVTNVDTVPSSCMKDKLPSIENPLALEGVGAQLSSHVDMQAVTAAYAILPVGGASDLSNGTSADAPALLEGDKACSLTGHSVGASDLQAIMNDPPTQPAAVEQMPPDYSTTDAAIGQQIASLQKFTKVDSVSWLKPASSLELGKPLCK
ncbi:hypothetical protein Nepgr_018917 [Nepenthes gracilis]|uniref:Uncharacterized protein n=1 Tax=Nepenthes gracilis TaxID=150966 RepID=A0AAD3SW08_NEPGR|nr:hypothetical protein Nepgr_018917 [Nepenthes gracilis]